MTNQFSACLLLDYLGKYINEHIHIGWGVGKTFIQAQANAKKACNYSVHNHVSSTYVIENDERVIGPLVSPLFSDDNDEPYNSSQLKQIQTKVNMTKDHIHKILLAFKLLKSEQIASADFAEVIG